MRKLTSKVTELGKKFNKQDETTKALYQLTATFDIPSHFVRNYIDGCIVQKFSRNLRIGAESRDEWSPPDLVHCGKGTHVVKLKSGYGLYHISQEEGENSTINFILRVPLWIRDKVRAELNSVIPIMDHNITFETVMPKRRSFTFLSKAYSKHEMFVRKEDYDNLDSVFVSMLAGPEAYRARNKAFKETVLLYGPPGTAKSTLIRHMATKHGCGIVNTVPEMYDSLQVDRPDNRSPLIILMEDIDACKIVTKDGGEQSGLVESPITYSEIINWMDGMRPMNNVIIIMTTNYKDKLIPSLIRGGRVDRQILMDDFTNEEIKQFFDPKWDDIITSLVPVNGKTPIKLSMIPDLRLCEDEASFHETMRILN